MVNHSLPSGLEQYERKDIVAKMKWEMLNRTPLGRRLKVKQIDLLSMLFDAFEVAPGVSIFEEGTTSNFMGILITGRVEIQKDKRIIAAVAEGATFGELGIIDGAPRSASAVTKDTSLVLIVTRERLQEVLDKDATLGREVLWYVAQLMAQRLRSTTGSLVEYLEAS